MPRYRVSSELLEAARRAKEWHETTGMKVAKPPAIPNMVASWLLLHCIDETEPTPASAPATGPVLNAGWGWPVMSRKAHYFRAGQDTSVCGRWMYTGLREGEPSPKIGPDDCTTCARMAWKAWPK